jgi:hypothetical protein
MTRRRKLIIGMVGVALTGVLATALWPKSEETEPIYKGRKLSDWLQGSSMVATKAVQAIGTNGIPFYLEWMNYQPGLAKKVEMELVKLSQRLLHIGWSPYGKNYTRAFAAWRALRTLGEQGEPAIPQLLRYAQNRSRGASNYEPLPSSPKQAVQALADIRLPAMPAFVMLMRNADPEVRVMAIATPQYFYGDTSVLAQVRNSLEDPDSRVRDAATNKLNAWHYDTVPPVQRP